MSDDSKSASEALAEAAALALDGLAGLNHVYEGAPLQAAFPYAMVEAGPERDWSHKSGEGREVRLAVILRDEGERPARLRGLARAAEEAIGGLGSPAGWRLVTMVFLRSRLLREPRGPWVAATDWRARMLKE